MTSQLERCVEFVQRPGEHRFSFYGMSSGHTPTEEGRRRRHEPYKNGDGYECSAVYKLFGTVALYVLG